MDESREADKAFFRKIGLWDLVNRLKRNSDVERAAVARQYDLKAADLPGFGQEVPWGNNTTITQSATSPLAWIGSVAAIALTAGALGFGASHFLKESTPQPEAPPPVNAVLEWEITPNERTSGNRSIFIEEHSVLDEASGGVGGGVTE